MNSIGSIISGDFKSWISGLSTFELEIVASSRSCRDFSYSPPVSSRKRNVHVRRSDAFKSVFVKKVMTVLCVENLSPSITARTQATSGTFEEAGQRNAEGQQQTIREEPGTHQNAQEHLHRFVVMMV